MSGSGPQRDSNPCFSLERAVALRMVEPKRWRRRHRWCNRGASLGAPPRHASYGGPSPRRRMAPPESLDERVGDGRMRGRADRSRAQFALLLARFLLSEADVPTRQAYVVAV